MEDQDESDLGQINMDALERRLRQQVNNDAEEEENDPFDGSFSGSDTSTVQGPATSDGEPKQVLEDKGDARMDLSDDEDTVNELKVDDNSLSTFAKRVQAASAQQLDVENDEVSTVDPFENLTDSDAPVMHQLKKGEFDISSAIHSQTERREFDIDSLVEQFRAAQRAHEEVFGNALSLPRVQAMLAPQMKLEISKQVQVEFLKQCDCPIAVTAKTDDVLDSYKTMLSACVEQHLATITHANRRRSFGSKRRLHSRVEDRDLSDAQTYIHSFLNALLSAYSELIIKAERDETRQWIENRIKSVEECLAEMVAQIQAEIGLDRASRVDNTASLEGVIIERFSQLEQRIFQVESPEAIRLKERRRQQFSSDIPSSQVRQTQVEKHDVQFCEKKQGCDCSRWLMLLLQLCTVLLLFEVLHFSFVPFPKTRQSFLS